MTQEQKILELFRSNNGRFQTKDIPFELAFEYRRAISMLRKKGHIIIAARLTQNNWNYRLLETPVAGKHKFEESGQGVLIDEPTREAF